MDTWSKVKEFLGSTKVWSWLISQFGGIALLWLAQRAGLPPEALSNITLALLGKMGIETSALMAARSYVDAHTSAAEIHAAAVTKLSTADKAAIVGAANPTPPPSQP